MIVIVIVMMIVIMIMRIKTHILTIAIPRRKEGDVQLLFCLHNRGRRGQDTRWDAWLSRNLVYKTAMMVFRCIQMRSIQILSDLFRYFEMYLDIIRCIHRNISWKTKNLKFRGSTAWDVRRTVAMSRCYGGVYRGD